MAKRYVRADGYGNLPGFSPKEIYRIEGEGSDLIVTELRQEGFGEEPDTPINPSARGYLEAFGIKPEDMLRAGHTMTGYAAIVRDEEGNTVNDFGFKKQERRAWPTNFDYQRFVDLLLDVPSAGMDGPLRL